MRTLVVTNDFPPRAGGIQSFVASLAARLPPDDVIVYAPAWPGAAAYDATQPYPVIRHPTSLMLPAPSVLRQARQIVRAEDCTAVWFGAAAPLGLLADGLRRSGVRRFVASTHGHEVAWARLPLARHMLGRIGRSVDVVTFLGDYTRERLASAFGCGAHLARLPPGVDTDVFRPDADREGVRRRHRLVDRPVVVCVSRLVRRKGQDVLLHAFPEIRRRVPGAALLVVGDGPDAVRLRRLAAAIGVADAVRFTGSVPSEELPAYYAAGDVFTMPCRTRRAGLDLEGLGIVYLEASATGLPVVAGRSGGASDAVLSGETGYVVDGREPAEVAERVVELLVDPAKSAAMGERGRAWVEREWRWDVLAGRLRGLLAGTDGGAVSPAPSADRR